ncbi:hypothetical protein Jab_2c30670 [Janthinobacterium sp. HH01]|uniref:hypothetical protein n=1 Tax=Janthinobacterium sp. HH01 TaxID=1198452 RepID=UPI0002AECEFF|nr:hypothetical protein [Janthinobacterium sp. HH01]ELX10965.1 hypothetical protein Jab_2c30670 [Janthinobacterium sp. HH01]
MDQHKLRSLVFEKTGVRIDVDDPVFALVALNEAVLAETVERHIALIDAASQELVQHARSAVGLGAQHDGVRKPAALDATNEPAAVGAAAAGYAPAPAMPVRAIATQSPAITPRELRLLGAAAGISVLSALLVLGGQAAFFKPLPAPAPVIEQARALTPEQSAALANADKLNKAIQKLDPKLRAQLQAELQK